MLTTGLNSKFTQQNVTAVALLSSSIFFGGCSKSIVAEERGRLVRSSEISLRSDQIEQASTVEQALRIVTANPRQFSRLSDSYRSNADVAGVALRAQPDLALYVSEPLLSNADFFLTLARENPFAFFYAPKALRADRDIAGHYLQVPGARLEALDESLLSDNRFVLSELGVNQHLSPLIPRGNLTKDAFKRFLISYPQLYRDAPDALKADFEIALHAVKHDQANFPYLPASLASDRAFLRAAILENVFLAKYIEQSGSLTPDLRALTLRIEAALDRLAIKQQGRFSVSGEIIRARARLLNKETYQRFAQLVPELLPPAQELLVDDRPACFLFYASSDYNDAFVDLPGVRSNIDVLSFAYQLYYFEIDSQGSLRRALESLKHAPPSSFTMFVGHGDEDKIELRALDGSNPGTVLHKADFRMLQSYRESFVRDGTFILLACSAASKDGRGKSFSQVIHQTLPHLEVIAPLVDTHASIILDEEGLYSNHGFFSTEIEVLAQQDVTEDTIK